MYLILLVLGLGIGAVFLVLLLIGDRKEAQRETQRKAVQEQIAQSSQPVEGAWPPPPSVSAPPAPSVFPVKPAVTYTSNRKMVRNFFLIRNYTIATVVLAYIIYSCVPRFGFGWVLVATAGAAVAVWGVMTFWKRRVQN